jgi:hypothetical protein
LKLCSFTQSMTSLSFASAIEMHVSAAGAVFRSTPAAAP